MWGTFNTSSRHMSGNLFCYISHLFSHLILDVPSLSDLQQMDRVTLKKISFFSCGVSYYRGKVKTKLNKTKQKQPFLYRKCGFLGLLWLNKHAKQNLMMSINATEISSLKGMSAVPGVKKKAEKGEEDS